MASRGSTGRHLVVFAFAEEGSGDDHHATRFDSLGKAGREISSPALV